MKSKIFALSIATLILWGSTTEPRSRYLTAAGVKAVAKLVNSVPWVLLTGWAGYNFSEKIPMPQAGAVPATSRQLPAQILAPAIILGSAALVYGGIKTYQWWNKKTAETSTVVPQETVA
jgi:hypothetical protein